MMPVREGQQQNDLRHFPMPTHAQWGAILRESAGARHLLDSGVMQSHGTLDQRFTYRCAGKAPTWQFVK
jgi:hypothetical protein